MSVIKNSNIEENNSLTKNYLTIGNSDVAYGPTQATGFYNGIEPPVGGWVIYRANAAGKLNIYVANDNNELVHIVNRLIGNLTLSSWELCLEWLSTQSDYFVINKIIPDITTDNLQVYIDAGMSESYPNTGSSWYNLSLDQNHGTLVNAPTHTNTEPECFTFSDASYEHATIPNIGDLNIWTIEAWFKLNSSLNSKVTSIVCNQYNLIDRLNFSLGTNNAPSTYKLCVGFFDVNGWHNTTGFDPLINTWYHVVGTYDGTTIRQYVNGVATGGTLSYTGIPGSGGDVRMMRRWDSSASNDTNYVNGDLAIVRIYYGALTDNQILNNYNAEKDRFIQNDIVQDSLFMKLDASTYSSGLWLDSTSNNNDATINGATWSSTDGGIFDFDGSNDTISIPHTSELSLNTSTQKTIQVWVKFDSLASLNAQVPVFGKLSSSFGFDGYWGGLYSNAGELRVTTNGTGIQRISTSPVIVTTNTWYLLTFISQITNTSGTTKLYVNDTEYISTQHGTDTYNETNTLYLGYIGNGVGSNYLNGKIGACYFYTKGLNSSEIAQNFNATKGRYGL
jgi:hypothetical protein